MKKILIISFLGFIFKVNGQQNLKIDSVFNSFLENNILSNAHIGVQLFDVSSKSNLINYNSEKLFVPASIQKLFTTATALELLPSNFSFVTRAFISGELDSISGFVNGNLLITGSGDPSLESSYFKNKSFIKELKEILSSRAIKGFSGSLILIDNHKDIYQVNSNWLWGDIGNYYGAGISNFSFKDNMIEVYFNSSTKIGEHSEISKIYPENIHLDIENKVVSGESSKDLAYGFGGPYNTKRTIEGEIPAGRNNFKVKVSMHNPASFFKAELNKLIFFKNNEVDNSIMDTLLNYNSPPIMDLLTHMNYKSNNNYTEHILLKTMKNLYGVENIELAALKMNEYWNEKLALNEIFKTVDACGLSRKNLVSPEIMNRLLAYVLIQKKYKFIKTLPVAGVSGTLKYLGRGSVIENNFIGKSGSMDGVKCYSGYFLKRNKKYPFTIMVNNFSCSSAILKTEIVDLMIGIYNNL